jgi:hypothetical protein
MHVVWIALARVIQQSMDGISRGDGNGPATADKWDLLEWDDTPACAHV